MTPEQREQVQSQTSQELNNTCIKGCLLCYRIFFWLHPFKYKVWITWQMSYKYKFWFSMNAFFMIEKAKVPIVASPATSWWWLLSKQFTRVRWATISRTLRKTTSKENHDQVADRSLQGKGYTDAKIVTPERRRMRRHSIRARTIDLWYQSCHWMPLCSMLHARYKEWKWGQT